MRLPGPGWCSNDRPALSDKPDGVQGFLCSRWLSLVRQEIFASQMVFTSDELAMISYVTGC